MRKSGLGLGLEVVWLAPALEFTSNNMLSSKGSIGPTYMYLDQMKNTDFSSLQLPQGASEIQHEVELGVVIGSTACCVSETAAVEYIGGYALALDMTDREAQSCAKKSGLPWTLGKGFDTSCPVSHFIEKASIADPQNVGLWLNVNGNNRQRASTAEMIFSIPYLISWISHHMTLEPGDLILTGTPHGVGDVRAGDHIDCGIADLLTMSFDVESRN